MTDKQREINRRILETLAEFKRRLDEIEKRVGELESETKHVRGFMRGLELMASIGEYRLSNCGYISNGECTIWKQGDKPLTSKYVCAVCNSFIRRSKEVEYGGQKMGTA